MQTPVAVEKFTHQKMAKKLCIRNAVYTTFSVWVDIFYRLFWGKWTFSTTTPDFVSNKFSRYIIPRNGTARTRARADSQWTQRRTHRAGDSSVARHYLTDRGILSRNLEGSKNYVPQTKSSRYCQGSCCPDLLICVVTDPIRWHELNSQHQFPKRTALRRWLALPSRRLPGS